jgi:eukaryotic-like serine/threonine-protein kinase
MGGGMTDVVARLGAALSDRYVIERELGAGGMATVYLAHDVRHDRKVALKVLRPELSAILGGERFLTEIKTTANLQHPHILGLFDSGEADGAVFYVMPYVDGESLRDRLNREKQLPVDEAVRIAREVADALEYAHQHKIVHRDIKPENILLHGGHAMVADFGIALAASRSDGGTRMTETGMSLGTPHYMSPEQAMGEKEITPKADIYALGAVLYEMLTAEPPFTGATAQAIIARVMTEEPRSLTLQRRTIPPHVEAVVRKALEKLPADRFASAQDFTVALGNVSFAGSGAAAGVARPSAGPSARRAVVMPWAAVVVVAALGAYGTFRPRALPPPPPVARFALAFETHGRVVDATGAPVALSPDGSRIAYTGTDSGGTRYLYLRALDRADPVQIGGTRGAMQPFFSPDGAFLGFQQDGKLRKVALAGGAVVTIADATTMQGASWGTGDVIVFSAEGMLFRVSAAGGRPDTLARPDTAIRASYRWPDVLPDGRTVLFTEVLAGQAQLAVVAAGDSVRRLGQSGMSPRWVDGGWLAFVQSDGTPFAAPFDFRRLRLTGEAQPITDGVRMGPALVGKVGVARSGALVFLGGMGSQREIVLVERGGMPVALAGPSQFYSRPRFSPDGRRLAYAQLSFGVSGSDVWVYDLRSANATRVTFDSASNNPEWTPDGRTLVFTRTTRTAPVALYTIAADGSGVPESLLAREDPINEVQFAGGERRLVVRTSGRAFNRDIWTVPLDSPQAARALVRTPFQERSIAVSPDGAYVAYVSDATGDDEVYVRRIEEGSGNWKVSATGGREPRWSGRELLYRNRDTIVSVTMVPGSEPSFTERRNVLVGRFNGNADSPGWDVSPDGRTFAFTRDYGQEDIRSLQVILHWFAAAQARRSAR